MATEAEQRATAKSQGQEASRKACDCGIRQPGKRKASESARKWKQGTFPQQAAPPINRDRCSRCSGFGHTASDHYDVVGGWTLGRKTGIIREH